ncbi:hypothetical protein [Methylorubrum salsuginis]|uniref:Uncharacterized protein n=1 Tax=Methylorubrum salsuginis TaxID=414703 RepID=A0A1I4D223_9HYPH|nr:hypothetical protein [Methylorubrum salsuginis]SFK86121.1 hypothetical protein SAMN04488125_10581 [Methylorubrum salsuginis]
MSKTIDPPIFVYLIPSLMGFLERATAANEPRQFTFDLISAIDELLLYFKPGRSYQLSEQDRRLLRSLTLQAFQIGRSMQLAGCDATVLELGLRALGGLVDILALPEEERDGQQARERAFIRTLRRLRHVVYGAQLAIDEEQFDADVELPPLSDQGHHAGPQAAVLPFRQETPAAVERQKARGSQEAAALWKRAEDYFRAADNLDDPATPYATALRLLSEGLAAGYQLSIESRVRIGIAMLGARGAIGRVFVPDILPAAEFEMLRARAHHILDALETDTTVRAQAEPEWIAGICAEASLHANVIANVAHMRTYQTAELSARRYFAQQAG